jgi:RNA polymerase sigma-70 factor (ECF subfamily)
MRCTVSLLLEAEAVQRNYSLYNDDELLAFIRENDEQAFHALYKRYWKRLLVQALIKLGSQEEAEEIVQTVFMNLWQRRLTITLKHSFATYIAAAAKYEILAQLGRRKKEDALKKEMNAVHTDVDLTTSHWLDYEQLRNELEKNVSALPEKCRLVFRLSRDKGLTERQIAHTLHISPKTVEAHIGKALKLLRTSLQNFLS